jgi:hypothetical protein
MYATSNSCSTRHANPGPFLALQIRAQAIAISMTAAVAS